MEATEYTDNSNISFLGKIIVLLLILGIGYAGQRIYVKNSKKSTIIFKGDIQKNVQFKNGLVNEIKSVSPENI